MAGTDTRRCSGICGTNTQSTGTFHHGVAVRAFGTVGLIGARASSRRRRFAGDHCRSPEAQFEQPLIGNPRRVFAFAAS